MLPPKIKLYFDGSCLPKNPGGIAAYGWRITDENGNEICSHFAEECRGENATNNIAEWAGVLNGVKHIVKSNWSGHLEILGDSQLVIYQLMGKYRVKKDTLIPYHEECMSLLSGLQWSAKWIPREENEHCDNLSKKLSQ